MAKRNSSMRESLKLAHHRIWFLERMIKDYYTANYEAKRLVGINPGMSGIAVLEGNEECLVVRDAKEIKRIIDDLPLMDCGVY